MRLPLTSRAAVGKWTIVILAAILLPLLNLAEVLGVLSPSDDTLPAVAAVDSRIGFNK